MSEQIHSGDENIWEWRGWKWLKELTWVSGWKKHGANVLGLGHEGNINKRNTTTLRNENDFWTLDPCFISFYYLGLLMSCVLPGLFRITNWIAESSDFSLWFWHLSSWSRTIFPDWHEELHDCLAFWCCSSAKSFSILSSDCTNPSSPTKKNQEFYVWRILHCTAMIRWTEKSYTLGWKLVGTVQLPSIALHFFALKAVGLLSVRWQRMQSVCVYINIVYMYCIFLNTYMSMYSNYDVLLM